MKIPVHPRRLIKSEIETLGLSTAAAAKGLGVTRQQLHNVISGKSCVTALRAEGRVRVGRKAFFFEKKKQKTFILLAPSPMNRSFLVLFFKKERLPSLRLVRLGTADVAS